MISKKQRIEWTENPVTLELLGLVQKELDKVKDTPIIDCLVFGDPQKTQDNLVELHAKGYSWVTLAETLQGDWDYLEIEDED